MLRIADQASKTSAVAFLQRKKRRLVATVLRLFLKKISAKTPFLGGGFFGTFLPPKKYGTTNFLGVSRLKKFAKHFTLDNFEFKNKKNGCFRKETTAQKLNFFLH